MDDLQRREDNTVSCEQTGERTDVEEQKKIQKNTREHIAHGKRQKNRRETRH
jgi:hypothetical protein